MTWLQILKRQNFFDDHLTCRRTLDACYVLRELKYLQIAAVFYNSSVFNIGRYARHGYTASVTEQLSEHFSATLAYGRGGVLLTDGRTLETTNPDELRSRIRSGQRHWARGRIAGITPVIGTRFAASYEWTDHASLVPGHVYLTQKSYPETGLNIRLRQPLPSFGSLPGRIEATAELRNLLAQGYLPIALSDGRRLILSNSPRGLRGAKGLT